MKVSLSPRCAGQSRGRARATTWAQVDTFAFSGANCMSAELARQFLDTNVPVYAHDRSAGEKYRRALHLLEQMTTQGNAALSVQVLQESFVKCLGASLLSRLVRRPGARAALR